MDHTVSETRFCGALDRFELPLNDLLYRAHTVHRQNFDANRLADEALIKVERLESCCTLGMPTESLEWLGLTTG